MKYDFKKQIRSFGYAWKGLRQCIGKEQNLSFHLITTIIVIGAGVLFDITRMDDHYPLYWYGRSCGALQYGN